MVSAAKSTIFAFCFSGMLKDLSGTFDWSIWLCAFLLIIGGGFMILTQYHAKKARESRGHMIE